MDLVCLGLGAGLWALTALCVRGLQRLQPRPGDRP